MEYTVVEKYTLLELIEEVNKRIKVGWIPYEGIVVGTNFYQAMTKGNGRKVQAADEEKSPGAWSLA